MRHFDFLTGGERERLFAQPPQEFGPASEPAVLATGLGATLYMPATRPDLHGLLARQASRGVTSAVVCLEDAVADADVAFGESNLIDALRRCAELEVGVPLVFVRVRTPDQLVHLVHRLGPATEVLAGFVLPKFSEDGAAEYLDAVASLGANREHPLLAMPVLETTEVGYLESRADTLLALRRLVDKYRPLIPAVRIGATDLSASFGLRRSPELTIYDVRVVADVIADVVNVFGRADNGYPVAGPVWEHFPRSGRAESPPPHELDGLIREVGLDRANGLTGKSVIHPAHVAPVHALSVVTAEDFADAEQISASVGGGAAASLYRNKMNESKPHAAWARRTLIRAHVFGVARENTSFLDLLAASRAR